MEDNSTESKGQGGELVIPPFMEWTNDWEIESNRAGKEYSAGKSAIEISLCRLYLIWYTGLWQYAKVPSEVDASNGKAVAGGENVFADFNEVIAWFESNWGFARSTIYERI